MKVKVSEATPIQLNWLVAKCKDHEIDSLKGGAIWYWIKCSLTGALEIVDIFSPSTDWSQGGPIIEREGISLTQFNDYPQWTANHPQSICYDGPTPLIAAMRCFVAANLGDEIDVPEELT